MDGSLKEIEWQTALKVTNFKQIEPSIGSDASENVTSYIMTDNNYIYVAAKMEYKNPQQIFSVVLERDARLFDEDFFEIHLDTYNDKTNVLVFRTNPLSVREDFEVNRNGEVINLSWNTFWDVKSNITDTGWSTEMRIPFISLRYQKSTENTMRFKVVAKYKLKNERVVYPLNNIDIASAIYHFTNSQEIKFYNLPSSRNLYITPYVKGNLISRNILNNSKTEYESQTNFLEQKNYATSQPLDKILSNIGVDIKYKPNANNTIDFTLNTDFAEVEADDRIINISRFPIFLPEKRLFFLENADLFNSNMFDHRLFFSRRIGIENGIAVPILSGLRWTSNTPSWQFGALSMQTHEVNGDVPSYNMSVARIRKTIGNKGSSIGILNTNRLSSNNNNHLLAMDGNIRFTNNIRFSFTTATTFDRHAGNWKSMYGAAINTFRNNGFGFEYRFRDYQEGFTPGLGFLSRPNTKNITLNNGWRKTFTNHKSLQYLSIGHYLTKFWVSNTGENEIFQTNLYVNIFDKKGNWLSFYAPVYHEDNLYQTWNFSNGINIPAKKYTMWKVNPFFTSTPSKRYQYSIDIEYGDFYGGKQLTTMVDLSYDFSKYFKPSFGMTNNQLHFPESFAELGTSNRLNLSRYFTRFKFNFSAKSALNTYFQYDTNTDKIGMNLRFRYNQKEGTDLYLVYNHNVNTNRDALSPRVPFTDNQVFVAKFSKTFIK